MGLISKIKNKLVVAVILWNYDTIKNVSDAQIASGGIGKLRALFRVHHKQGNGYVYTVITSNNPMLSGVILDSVRAGMNVEASKNSDIRRICSIDEWEALKKTI